MAIAIHVLVNNVAAILNPLDQQTDGVVTKLCFSTGSSQRSREPTFCVYM